MTDLIIRRPQVVVSMGGASSVKSVSKASNFTLLMSFSGTAKVTSYVEPVNTIVNESVLILIKPDYEPISTNKCIGSTIQTHGPPMVDNRPFLHSFTVFTAISKNTYQNIYTPNFNENAASPLKFL